MLRSAKAMLLATATVIGITGQSAFGTAIPDVIDIVPQFAQFGPYKSGVGPDGNNRFIWDTFSPGSIYAGSNLWIMSPTTQVVAVGDTPIPANVGTGLTTVSGVVASNTALNAAASGNTTLAFAFFDPTHSFIDHFGTWTFNAQGHLIAGASYGPFANTQLLQLYFKSGQLIAIWAIAAGPSDDNWSFWTLDEFGNVTTGVGPFGPFSISNTIPASVIPTQLNGQSVIIVNWLTTAASPKIGLNVWTINQSGNVIATNSFGPF